MPDCQSWQEGNIWSCRFRVQETSEVVYENGNQLYGSVAPEEFTLQFRSCGLYSLIMHSKTSFAKDFQRLVYKEILPSIWKHGTFQMEKGMLEYTHINPVF